MSRKTGNLRIVAADSSEPGQIGERLRLLREAVTPALTQQELADRTRDAAAALGATYSALDRTEVNKIERGSIKFSKYEMRAVVARALDLSTDNLSAYVEGRIDLAEVLRRRGPGLERPVILYRNHPNWDAAKSAALKINPALTEEDFDEIAGTPTYPDAPLDGPIAEKLGSTGSVLRALKRRSLLGHA